jgi:EAL domain-containing protein (putative c-di-GMP-specific phosphodiesterase class I)/ActR/RegA family two-component response regulator
MPRQPAAAERDGLAALAHDAAALVDAVALVVDDNADNVLLLRRLLERLGVGRVVGITDPRQAVAHYQMLDPDVILLDLHMPHLDGLAVLHALRRVMPTDSYTPVLVLTADASVAAKEQALRAGAKDFLTKPFQQTEVVLRVKNLLETRALHRLLQQHNAQLAAQLAATKERERRLTEQREEQRRRIEELLDKQDITMVFQPIVDLTSGAIVGAEALARFSGTPRRPPNEWFADAANVGLQNELELLAVRRAVGQVDDLPAGTYLSVNVTPDVAVDERLVSALAPAVGRCVLELTEHVRVEHYEQLVDAVGELRRQGARIAVDDAGSGYASLQHVLRIAPDMIKLDQQLIRDIDRDPARQALATALVSFGKQLGATITAEGIETLQQLDTLRRLQVPYGQGYHLGRPRPLPLLTLP